MRLVSSPEEPWDERGKGEKLGNVRAVQTFYLRSSTLVTA